MKKPKINIIKFNIIKAAIITLICISCKPNSMPLELKNEISTNIKDLKPLEQKFQNRLDRIVLILQKDAKCKKQKEALITQTFNPLKNEDLRKSEAEQLQIINTYLKDQEAQEDREIAKIAASNYDFLKTFKIYPHEEMADYTRMRLKRMIYSALGYEKQKIERFKKNLEKLCEKDKDEAQELFKDIITTQRDLDSIKEIIEKANQLPEDLRKEVLKKIVRLLNTKEQFANLLNQIAEICN
ncbi:complement regulator-acquiring protein [Borreliella lusitaniae]|uniref:complement regulator-acquiring protein n=1 Tax=Borreliella lusitaniae TaxID=100177 RepID=UPI002930F24C|nr:complement regulator-acquiring protein [Borreliella lusitaniae]WNY67339.1 complement regulator-acquiring protein [Borreliella lusitaniae]